MTKPDVQCVDQAREHVVRDRQGEAVVGPVLCLHHDGTVLVAQQVALGEQTVELLQFGMITIGLVLIGRLTNLHEMSELAVH